MSKRTILLAVGAVLLMVAALFSLYIEKKSREPEPDPDPDPEPVPEPEPGPEPVPDKPELTDEPGKETI